MNMSSSHSSESQPYVFQHADISSYKANSGGSATGLLIVYSVTYILKSYGNTDAGSYGRWHFPGVHLMANGSAEYLPT